MKLESHNRDPHIEGTSLGSHRGEELTGRTFFSIEDKFIRPEVESFGQPLELDQSTLLYLQAAGEWRRDNQHHHPSLMGGVYPTPSQFMMGARLSSVEGDVYGRFKVLLAAHGKVVEKRELNTLVKWVLCNLLNVVVSPTAPGDAVRVSPNCNMLLYSVGSRLYDLTTWSEPLEFHMLPAFHRIYEINRAEQKLQDPTPVTTFQHGTALTPPSHGRGA